MIYFSSILFSSFVFFLVPENSIPVNIPTIRTKIKSKSLEIFVDQNNRFNLTGSTFWILMMISKPINNKTIILLGFMYLDSVLFELRKPYY